ncbi:DinB family protein [Cognatitamlana onchidii]|uniref:DinB family protein n=1 Tax=Cognatitamlana onchidii TaxID=2562860 RepID=UPI0010A5E576|nr:DinB family protein [Algibacter onchidii]
MSSAFIIKKLEENILVFEGLLKNKSLEETLWRTKPEKWCLLEIVCHLLDEEQYDFKARLKHALETPQKPLVPIDPVGWVARHDYISKNYNDTLIMFLNERKKSIAWLKNLKKPSWGHAIKHPELGELSAELFLNNWLAHDYLHIRQILNYQYLYLKQQTNTPLSYAGNW